MSVIRVLSERREELLTSIHKTPEKDYVKLGEFVELEEHLEFLKFGKVVNDLHEHMLKNALEYYLKLPYVTSKTTSQYLCRSLFTHIVTSGRSSVLINASLGMLSDHGIDMNMYLIFGERSPSVAQLVGIQNELCWLFINEGHEQVHEWVRTKSLHKHIHSFPIKTL